MLQGKKTHLVSALMIVHAVVSMLLGEEIKFQIQEILTGLGLSALRAGVAKQSLLIALLVSLAPFAAMAGDEPDPDPLTRINISPFASYRVHEFGKFNGKFGGGLAAGYSLTKHVTLEAEVIGERFDDSRFIESLAEAGANFKLSARPGQTLNPYALLGYTRNLDEDQNRMNAGVGLEVTLGRHASLFADGRWTHDFETLGHALFRSGVSVKF